MLSRRAHAASTGATESEQSMAARRLSYLSWAVTDDRTARTAPARAARDRKFLEQAGGDLAQAEALRKAFYVEMALKSAQARRRNREARKAGGRADAA